MNSETRIGLFGGSFNPIHTGHLILAEMAADFADLSHVYFMPTAIPPHKEARSLADYQSRRRMVELAIEGNPRFELSLLEGDEDVSFTCESVLHFKERGYDRERLHLLVGGDSLDEIRSWRNPEIVYANATVIALARPGYEQPPELPAGAAVIVLDTGRNTISSSDIRRRIRDGRSIRYLVPRAVELFIAEHALYRNA